MGTLKRKAHRKPEPPKTPRTRKPEHMTLEAWQTALRREYGREQKFFCTKPGGESLFAEYAVTNPQSKRTYRVAIRGIEPGSNFCSCPDFHVNTLGTCKHIEWLLAKLERNPGGKKALKAGFNPVYSEVFLKYGVQRTVRLRLGTLCPESYRRKTNEFFDAEGVLRPEKIMQFEVFARESAQAGHEVRLYDDALELVARLRDDAVRQRKIAQIFEGPGAAKAFKSLLKAKLYPYQQKGALFAAKAGRCLIADDMGLGKTIQSIAAVEILTKTTGVDRILVVCPTALKHQWKQEIERFTNHEAQVIEGFLHTRRELYRKESFYKITNYDTIHRDIDAIQGWHPDVVILDEAQRIKNWETRRAKSVKKINAAYAIVLTGTPLENRLSELHSIMEFVDTFRLGPLFRFLDEHQHVNERGRVIGYRNLDHIKESLSSVLIRRRKKEVLLELPERTDKHFFVDMTQSQRSIHNEHRDTVAKIVSKWRRKGFLTEQEQRTLMIALQFMRMSCNSTYLIDKTTRDGQKIDECHALLEDILEAPETKAVVFSQWLGTHELLLNRMNGHSATCGFYHGSLSSKERKSVIDRFKNDPACRVLLCTDSGGVGLNLQAASALINMDQPWNPAVLEQRIARIHRLGQHRNVQVYHFISRNTIEHGMLDVLKFKSAMFEGVLDGGEKEIFLTGGKMKKFMETVEQVSNAMPQHMPAQEELFEAADRQPEETAPAAQEETEAPVPSGPPSPWNDLLELGVTLLRQFGQAIEHPPGGGVAQSGWTSMITCNEQSGQPEFRIPLPDSETAQKLGQILAGVGDALKNLGAR